MRACTFAGEKPYKCVQCHKSFVSSGVLKSHIRTHAGTRAYRCVACDALFTTNGSLKRHLSTHSETRPFMCPYCQKTFKTSVNCKKHMKTHRQELALQAFHQGGATVQPLAAADTEVTIDAASGVVVVDDQQGGAGADIVLTSAQPLMSVELADAIQAGGMQVAGGLTVAGGMQVVTGGMQAVALETVASCMQQVDVMQAGGMQVAAGALAGVQVDMPPGVIQVDAIGDGYVTDVQLGAQVSSANHVRKLTAVASKHRCDASEYSVNIYLY